MNEMFFKMVQLSQEGFFCSQIMLIIGLTAQGKENPDVIRAMSGLICGMGYQGKICGALTGGVCLIGLYAGKGTAEEKEDDRLNLMIGEFVEWFEEKNLPLYDSIDCDAILEDNPDNRKTRCPQLVLDSLHKITEILAANGYELAG